MKPKPITVGEMRVIRELIQGSPKNHEIASKLNVTVKTIKYHLGNIYKKTGTVNRLQLIEKFKEIA